MENRKLWNSKKQTDNRSSKTPKERLKAKKDFDNKANNWREHGLTYKTAIKKKAAKHEEPKVHISLSFSLYRKPLEDEVVKGKKSHGGLVQKYHGTTMLHVPESQVEKKKLLSNRLKQT